MSARLRYLGMAVGLLLFCAAAPEAETTVELEITARERLNMPQIRGLEISYKPLRMIVVDIPDQAGKSQRKLVWYVAYRVTNRDDKGQMFLPEFTLETDTGKRYTDRVVPIAQKAIAAREDPKLTWHNSATIAGIIPPSPKIGASKSVYGIATWYDVDPKTDYFSIFVTGLSNGYKVEKTDEGQERTVRRTLELKFWRPGDEFFENEKEIRFVESKWLYR